jgi:magnesium transporter
VRHGVARELTSGLIIDMLIAAAFFPFAYLGGNGRVAATVALALLASRATPTGVAMFFPTLATARARPGVPCAGPRATVVQDLLSIVIYFAVAAALSTVGAVAAWRPPSEQIGPRPHRPPSLTEASLT